MELRGVEGVQVQIDATGLTPGSHAWHIHEGTCANEGAVVLAFTNEAQNQYHNYGSDVLVAGDDGWIEKDAQISPARLTRRQLTAEPHTISIHLNLLPPDETMACADLKMK